MKIAIFHGDFRIVGGGEKLIGILARGLKKRGHKVDLFTYAISEETKKIIPKGIEIFVSKKSKVKGFENDITRRYFFSNLNLSEKYDFFIFSSHSTLNAIEKNIPNLVYIHDILKTEIEDVNEDKNESYDIHFGLNSMRKSYSERVFMSLYSIKKKFVKKPIPEKLANFVNSFRLFLASPLDVGLFKFALNLKTVKDNLRNIDNIIVNSKNIQSKVEKIYRKKSIVVHPPIDTGRYIYRKPKNYWLSINRIYPLKRIKLQVEAFRKLENENLYIIGHEQNKKYYEEILKSKPKNVIFLGVVSEKELIRNLSNCKGFIFYSFNNLI